MNTPKSEIAAIDYIADFLGINADNPVTLQNLIEIENKKEFIKYMQKNINKEWIRYLPSPLAKLSELTIEYNLDRKQAINSFVSELLYLIEYSKLHDKTPKYTELQLQVIKKLGGLDNCFKLYDNNALEGALEATIRSKVPQLVKL